jgi:cyanophycinase
VPPRLVASTAKAAFQLAAGRAAGGLVSAEVATLTQGVLQTMSFTKLRVSAIVLLVLAVVGAGVALFTGRVLMPTAVATAPPAGKPAHPTDDNVLGLVPPRDARRPGAVMLHGGGELGDEHVAWFLELAGGKDARIVLVPSAYFGPTGHDRREFAATMKRRFGYWFRLASSGRIAHFELLYTDDPGDADDPAFVRPLASATGVWFFGGRQARLNYRYVNHFPSRTRFQEALRDVVRRGGVVGGTSAGMAALPEVMTLDQERPGESGPYRALAAHGMGLFDGAIVEQHFDSRSGRQERFTGLFRDSARLDRLAGRAGAGRRMLGLAVETSTSLVLQADRLEVLGDRNAHVFIKSPDGRTIHWHTLGSGDKVRLRRDARGQVVLTAAR